MINEIGIRMYEGKNASSKVTIIAKIPPICICPNAPILYTFNLNGIANANVANKRGMNLLIVSQNAKEDLNDVVMSVDRPLKGLYPVTAKRTPINMKAIAIAITYVKIFFAT
jgi:hypothetical protein